MKKIVILFLFLFVSHTANSQWVPLQNRTNYELSKVLFTGPTNGYLIGHNANLNRYVLYRTVNSAQSFDSTVFGVNDVLLNMFFLNPSTGWLCGSFRIGDLQVGKVWRSTNAGLNWSSITFTDTGTVNSVYFIDANVGYLIGNRFPSGSVSYKSFNGGMSWNAVTTIPPEITTARDVYFLNQNTGWILGTKNAAESRYPSILKTINGGLNWTNSDISGYIHTFLSYIKFFDANTGFAGGSRDTTQLGINPLPRMFKSTNGGASWVYQDLPYTQSPNIHFINGMYFNDANTGYAVGDRGSIAYTSNGGTNWSYQTSNAGLNINLEGISFNSGIGWVCGSAGTILNSGLTSVHIIGITIPKDYRLYQNFPNPFNPETKIRFEIPGQQVVNLRVYNILGEEVSSILNGLLNGGSYETVWNCSNFASGIYFYRLTAGNFTSVKKLELIK